MLLYAIQPKEVFDICTHEEFFGDFSKAEDYLALVRIFYRYLNSSKTARFFFILPLVLQISTLYRVSSMFQLLCKRIHSVPDMVPNGPEM